MYFRAAFFFAFATSLSFYFLHICFEICIATFTSHCSNISSMNTNTRKTHKRFLLTNASYFFSLEYYSVSSTIMFCRLASFRFHRVSVFASYFGSMYSTPIVLRFVLSSFVHHSLQKCILEESI